MRVALTDSVLIVWFLFTPVVLWSGAIRVRQLYPFPEVMNARLQEDRKRFLEAIEVDALGSEREEPGCLRFNVLQDAGDENGTSEDAD